MPALYPDVAVIHVHESDCYGNCRIRGISVADYELARASKRLIITAERLVDNDEIRATPHATLIPSFCVDAVCEVPCGAYPGNMPGEYFSDEDHLQQWLRSGEGRDAVPRVPAEIHLRRRPISRAYLRLCGGSGEE